MISRLIGDERDRTARDVAAALANVAHQLQERKIMFHQPKQIRQKDQQRREATEPDPLALKNTAVLSLGADPPLCRTRKRSTEYFVSSPRPMSTPNHSQ